MSEKHEHDHGQEHAHDHDHAQEHAHDHGNEKPKANLPVILIGLAVALIFCVAIFSYQVAYTEQAIVIQLGKIREVKGPGLHFRWPLPIQKVVKYDVRSRCFDGKIGKLEETPTADGKNITVAIYTVYRIKDLTKFQQAGGDIQAAEDELGRLMRTAKGAVVGSYRFDQIINSDPKKIAIPAMEKKMLEMIAPKAMSQYGLEVREACIRQIGVPEAPAKAIAERMISERKAEAAKYKSSGEKESRRIRTRADEAKQKVITDAEAEAKRIRAEGDAKAAEHYAVFAKDPELAMFLRKLDSMKKIMGKRTTLVLDTSYAPFDILKYGAPAKAPAKK